MLPSSLRMNSRGPESQRIECDEKSEFPEGVVASFDPETDRRYALDGGRQCPATRHKEAGSSFFHKIDPDGCSLGG